MTHGSAADSPRGGWLPWAALSLGIALAGWFVGMGVQNVRTADRFVTVKGVAEREVKAGPPGRSSQGDRQRSVGRSDEAQRQRRARRRVPAPTGSTRREIGLQTLRVTDILANPFRGEQRVGSRFILQQTVNPAPPIPIACRRPVRKGWGS